MAAVAGLAALAVVLVQNVVDETAEQISGSSARVTAARVAAEAINNDDDPDNQKRSACNRLDITYSDAFAEDSARKLTAHWTDKNTTDNAGDKNGGVCAIVTEAVAAAMLTNSPVAQAATCNGMDTGNSAVPEADRGGKGIEHVADTDAGTSVTPACVFSP
ncbi:MAG: hypothetical protein OXG47_09330 [bacterium]|nr:hypothetical protein [bacterium]